MENVIFENGRYFIEKDKDNTFSVYYQDEKNICHCIVSYFILETAIDNLQWFKVLGIKNSYNYGNLKYKLNRKVRG